MSSFDGEFYTVPPSWMDPKPTQKPGPPVLLGGAIPAALRRAGRIADGWMSRNATNLDEIWRRSTSSVRPLSRQARTRPGTCRRSGRSAPWRARGQAFRVVLADPRADAEWLGEQGVTELFYDLNWDPRIGNPDVSADSATEAAKELLEALKP